MRIALAAALVLGSTAALAQPPPRGPSLVTHVETVRDLAAVCDPGWGGVPRLEAIAYCQGFITAAGQYHSLLYPAGGRVRPLFCLPTRRPTVAETGVDFARWARSAPGIANEPALDGFLRWAQARYPCAPARGGPPGRMPR
jgi:hypothetical protein